MKKSRAKLVITALFWILVFAATVAIFNIFKAAALKERGYTAIGGEYVAWTIPIWTIFLRGIVQDIRSFVRRRGV